MTLIWIVLFLVPRLLSGGAATNPAPWRLRLGARGAWGRHGSGAGGRVDPAAEPLSLLTHSRSSSQIQKMEADDEEEAYLAAMASVRAREGAAVAPPLG